MGRRGFSSANSPTPGDDVIFGTNAGDLIDAGEGNDTIFGLGGDDFLFGWSGNDTIDGGDGNDWIFGEGGIDLLTGGAGNDIFGEYDQWLNGDTITDFSVGDIILIRDANISTFTFTFVGTTLTFTGAQTPEFSGGTMTLVGAAGAVLSASAHIEGGVQIAMISPPPSQDVDNDFNGDGRSDILWRDGTGRVTDWIAQSNGSFATNFANADASAGLDWQIAGTGDFNLDSRDDVLWRNVNTGAITDWLGTASGGFASNFGTAYYELSNSWHIIGTGDFNKDGRDDLLLRNNDGRVTNWLGQGNGGFTGNFANADANAGLDWHVEGIGDYNGDGFDDVLWRNDSGDLFNWLGKAGGGFTSNMDASNAFVANSWQVQASDILTL